MQELGKLNEDLSQLSRTRTEAVSSLQLEVDIIEVENERLRWQNENRNHVVPIVAQDNMFELVSAEVASPVFKNMKDR